MSLPPASTHIRVVITVDEVDHATVDQFAAEIGHGLEQCESAPGPDGSASALVIDLHQVRFLGSAGIRALIDADKAATARGDRIYVDGAHGVVLRCLEVTGLFERLQLSSDGADGAAPAVQEV